MPFAANLSLTNPVDRVLDRQENIAFAGTYYSKDHEERGRQMDYMLEPIIDHRGAIYDRMSMDKGSRYEFPKRFRPYIRPAVEFKDMTKLYRQFKVFLNVNTIVSSRTMMSRRVYELLASGTPVVSAPSRAMEEQFSGIVSLASTAQESRDAVEKLLSNDRHWWKISQKGIREVVLKHQYTHRAVLMRQIVLGQEVNTRPKLVTIVMSTKRWTFLDRIVENVARQTYPRVEVVFALHETWPEEKICELENRILTEANIERVKVLKFSADVSLGRKLNAAIAEARGDFIARFDDDDWYFPNYLIDMIITFDFSGADLVGKWSFPVWLEGQDKLILGNPGHEHVISTPFVAGATFVARRSFFESTPFADRSRGEDTDVIRRTLEAGGKIYSADHFNFINYCAADLGHHSWKAEPEYFEKTARVVGTKSDFPEWVV
jgi:glycosyltransferase involved in cell wall biosynthesis